MGHSDIEGTVPRVDATDETGTTVIRWVSGWWEKSRIDPSPNHVPLRYGEQVSGEPVFKFLPSF